MNKKVFNIIGWLLLLGMASLWIGFGYSSWYLLLLPSAYIFFSIYDGSMNKKLIMMKKLSMRQVILIIFAFISSVAIVFGLIQLANYLINHMLQLQGWIKTLSQFIAVIISLYPVKFTFGNVVYRVSADNKKY
ncbi:disulfide bond formation protein DsbD [Pueribacillus theae]|uniref:Disulfide bond formation protein DsbD n=1 Tax=Pueribacillus theae TaxID=2171751 RepID=A0A2U1JSJ0_9BACI|nr:disulfide bond formation protein DsbD [Pueribacillus theae]PWA07904.1 disulfide bond formation protein DsbD [Pueribacillus theae]